MEQENNYGLLLHKSDITLHRKWFKEMARLLGIQVIYRAPRPDKHYTTYAEIESNYFEPIATYCIFDEHPTQQTLKKMGWVSELQQSASIIHVEYDLPELQQGALFIIPSGLDKAKGRLFRVTKLTNSVIYPASMTCEIVPEFENTFEPSQFNHQNDSMNLMKQDNDPAFIACDYE